MQIAETTKLEYPAELDRYPRVVQFLQSKARKSKGTARTYGVTLTRLQRFLEADSRGYNIETILEALTKKEIITEEGSVIHKPPEIDVYHFLDSFVMFYAQKIRSVGLTVHGVKSYLQYWDVEINPYKFRNKVTLPANRKEDERPLDVAEIRTILLNADDPRFRAYLYFLASSGARAVEALMIRLQDLDFTANPTKVYMRAEYSKNKLSREVYISNEATEYLKKWIESSGKTSPSDLVFSISTQNPRYLYYYVQVLFGSLLKRIGMDERKTDGISKTYTRHEITLHTFRRFVETTIEDNTSLSFADYILGHKKSVYYTKKEPERRQIYRDKCLRALTYLDFKSMQKEIDEKNELQHELENIRSRLARAGY